MGERVYTIRKQWLDSLRYGGGMAEPPLPTYGSVYVHGLRVDRPGDPIRTPLRMLRAIPSTYIAEMHYIDRWNMSVPLGMRYSIFVTPQAIVAGATGQCVPFYPCCAFACWTDRGQSHVGQTPES